MLTASAVALAQSLPITLQADRAQSTAEITLSATFHTVHGKFQMRRGEIRFEPGTSKITGEIVFDATSGKTGNDGRDQKMHRSVLESERFPDITFRPDHVEGKVAGSGPSTVQVHGMFGLHGAEHELTVPVEVRLESSRWTASTHFNIPYVKWGLKNPSNAFLHVSDSVEVTFHAEGGVTTASSQ
jgi:polyisoprenoid-binding protein YceI